MSQLFNGWVCELIYGNCNYFRQRKEKTFFLTDENTIRGSIWHKSNGLFTAAFFMWLSPGFFVVPGSQYLAFDQTP